MIDLHTHTLFSDGELIPAELTRRASVLGYRAIAMTDHGDLSNLDLIIPRLVRVADDLAAQWGLKVIPGIELNVVTYDTQYDPANDIPGYEWLLDQGADVLLTGLPGTPIILKSICDEDEVVLFSMNSSSELLEDPGHVFVLSAPTPSFSYTLLNWIAENDWDYQTKGPAKIGAAGWAEPYAQTTQDAMEAYCDAHPDQFEWVGGYLTPFSPTWGPEVMELIDCDYVMVPSTGYGTPSFIKEFRDAGGHARFLGTDAAIAFLGLTLESVGWEGIDEMLFIFPYTWWNEDSETTDLANWILDNYHSEAEAAALVGLGGGYLGTYGPVYSFLNVLTEAVDSVGANNFSLEALYQTAIDFSADFEGYEKWSYSESKRTSWEHLGIHEASATAQDIVRNDTNWYPVLYTP